MDFLAVCLLVLAATCVQSFDTPTYKSDCASAWTTLSAKHTMCIDGDKGEDASFDTSVPLDYHNTLRGSVSPAATDMRKVYWDADVAAVAAKWARQCNMYGYHDTHKDRSMSKYKYMNIGQNMAMRSSLDWKAAIDLWHNEKNYFTFGVGSNTSGKIVGHYTQLVSKNVFKIGCGVAKCPGETRDEYYYICNYVTGDHSNTPYTKGTEASSCPGKSSSGLCECGDEVCLYQSESKGCDCDCQPNTSGDDCSTVGCNDATFCSQISEAYCPYINSGNKLKKEFFRYLCPKTCGLC